MKQLIFLLVLLLCVVAAQAVVIPQPPVLTFDKTTTGTIPDLNQKRDYEVPLDGAAEQKWCAPTAAADSVWYYGKGSYPNLIPAGANDNAKADNLIMALGTMMGTSDAGGGTSTNGPPPPSAVEGLQQYYDSVYPGQFTVGLVTAWTFLDGTGAPSAVNLWNWMAGRLYDCNDVLPIISFGAAAPQNEYDIPEYLDTTSAHLVMMTAYSYNAPNPDTITVYDPDDAAALAAHAFPMSVPAPVPVTSTVIPTGPAAQGTALSLNVDGVSPPFIVGAIISGPNGAGEPQGDLRDYGDAPEGGIAYPSLGVTGNFPTCITVGPATWIQHDNYGAYFGQSVDFELDGNAGNCPGCFPPYDQDECFQDGDAGLMFPDSFTIDALNNVVVCPQCTAPGTPLGQTCNNAVWGTDIDIWVHNTMPNHDPYVPGYINVLIDWNQDGQWSGASTCPTASAPEHVLQNFVFPANTINTLSSQMPAGSFFVIGPNSGYVWARFTITEQPVTLPWDGSGSFEDGESEDYLLKIDAGQIPDEFLKFQQLPLDGPEYFGHDEISTAYTAWDFSDPEFPIEIGYEGCYMADDFADLMDTPVVKLKWWGSYPEDEDPSVYRFLIAFERDIPADPDLQIPSHPGEVLYSEIVYLNTVLPLNPGEFSEINVSPGGPPCNERLYEYEAVLLNPFPEDPNTVYWLKIVALYDIGPAEMEELLNCLAGSGYDLCDFMNMPRSQQAQICDTVPPLPRWGWHNRDYTKRDPYASTPPAVVPGEHLAGTIYDPCSGADLEVWHFQDDAVSGEVFIDPYNNPFPEYPESPYVFQDQDPATWQAEHYVYTWPLCTGTGVDGPGPEGEGIDTFSKDLAFELYTKEQDCMQEAGIDISDPVRYAAFLEAGSPECWCEGKQCHGDADGNAEGTSKTGYYAVGGGDLDTLMAGWVILEPTFGTGIAGVLDINGILAACANFDNDAVADPLVPGSGTFPGGKEGTSKTGYYHVGGGDLNILMAYWVILEPTFGGGVAADCVPNNR